ncbi:MAG: crossover junction endodeoxyribonuclease RuvC [bacterium]|nr:crossover junction endodeoxyribonuclease RuvC [bacterium]
MSAKQTIIGIDPGYGRIGYGIIEKTGSKDWRALDFGCIETTATKEFSDRLLEVYETVVYLIKKYKPERMAIEELFFFKNLKTAINVAQARGVIMLAGVQHGLAIDEFTPLQVKQALTNYGRADKAQMQKMVATVLGIKTKIKSDDAADALAIALTAGQSLWIKKPR